MKIVYKLIDPITMEIRYIGVTNDLDKRFKEHISVSKRKIRKDDSLYHWIRGLSEGGRLPIIEAVAILPSGELSMEIESLFIRTLTVNGVNLFNKTKNFHGYLKALSSSLNSRTENIELGLVNPITSRPINGKKSFTNH